MSLEAKKLNARDWLGASLLGIVYTGLAFALTQRNLTYDGAAFLALFAKVPRPGMPHHPLFGYLFWSFLQIGKLLGAGNIVSGQIFAAACGGVSVSLFHLLLRRHAVSYGTAAIFSLLLGINMMVLENATSVELYTPSLMAIVLTLHATRSVEHDSSAARVFLLWLASMSVVSLHIGFSPWIFALYVALALREESWKLRGLWMLRGASVLAGIVLWIVLEGHATTGELQEQQGFFATYGRLESASAAILILFESPLAYIARYAGLILFPAAWGATFFWRERRLEFHAGMITFFIFWAVYSFWALDYGSFFIPLLPVWGLGGALTLDEAVRRFGGRGRGILLSGLFIYSYLFVFLPTLEGRSTPEVELMRLLEAALWVFIAACGVLSRWILPPEEERQETAPQSVRRFQLLFGVSAMVLSLLACLPRLINLKEPDDTTRLLEQFAEIAPPQARLVTSLSPFRPEVETGRETLSGVENWNDWNAMARNRKKLTEWLRERAAHPERRIFLDSPIYQQRDFVFGNQLTGNRTEVGIERLDFKMVKTPLHVFYEVVFRNPEDEKAVSGGRDLFDIEDWGGVAVRWTRKAAQMRIEATGRYVRLKYWIGHPDVSDVKPVVARFSVDGELMSEQRHIAKDAYTVTLDLGEGASVEHELLIEFNRTWTAPDGRELGAGLYPLEFGNQP